MGGDTGVLARAFLRIPPFPRHRAGALCERVEGDASVGEVDPQALAAALCAAQVGGDFWDEGRDPWTNAGTAWAVDAEGSLVRELRAGGARAAAAAKRIMAGWRPRDPFTGGPMGWLAAVAMLAEWRRLIESNRCVAGIFGIAGWKRETLDALLWDGSGPVRYRAAREAGALRPGDLALVWVARAAGGLVEGLRGRGVEVGEIEDGFIRSAGLGANCVAPLSVVCDPLGTHIDPSRASVLEALLADGRVGAADCARAARLRAALVAGGIGKYGAARASGAGGALSDGRRRVLVCGQVEDDRSVLLGGAGVTNVALLERARAMEPEAEIIWRPHPDVEAGHRRGAVAAETVAALADRVERTGSIAALFDRVDAVHVISSLAGFEALLRGCAVVVHGMPFYAGWGLTRDRAQAPAARLARAGMAPVTLDELVAAALILYPRYLDPVTRLPCGPEVLVARLAAGEADMVTPLVRLRAAWGGLRKKLR